MFDCQIGNTTPRIKFVRRHKSLCRTDIKTAGTIAAMIRFGSVMRQRGICQNGADKQP